MKEPTARELSLDILLSVTNGQVYSHIALRDVLDKYAYFEKGKRSLIKRLVEGVLENMLLLDEIIGQFSSVPVKKQKVVIRNLLRMAVYEIFYMDGIPAHASVNEAVKLAERRGFRNLKGFVNGVLRSIERNRENVQLPDSLSIRYSMPEWIVDRWTEAYGKAKTEELLQSFFGGRPLTVHLAKQLPDDPASQASRAEAAVAAWKAEGVRATPVETLSDAFFLSGIERLPAMQTFRDGLFFVQDLSSMKALSEIPIQPGMQVLDLCGAPGGKSLFLAGRIGDEGSATCRDLTDAKVSMIRENVERCHLLNMHAEISDARIFDPAWESRADLVIADLPCSGLGVLSRKPEIRYRITPQDITALAALQREILSVAVRYVKPGGMLFYSTCTITREENEDNASWLLSTFPAFTRLKEQQLFPEAGLQDAFYYLLAQRR
ncbi:MAG: 16S rRNA (cytosine(967)-C(5))-methyltransferase RsmB [Lachnospiraceae bacterium]|nr:16S rRNA (cytosine(967)-C(5))-methyltransferase RsmB [Lachnospiraceae bacterium]